MRVLSASTGRDAPAASSLLSSRWSRDNLITSHPARLYDGEVLERIDLESIRYLLGDLRAWCGPVELGAARLGVLSWDIDCEGQDGPFVLQLPVALDEPGRRGRTRRDVPRQNLQNLRGFIDRGLTRFAAEPRQFSMLGGNVPASVFEALPNHHPITFGQGAVRIELAAGEQAFQLGLGRGATAELLTELIAVLVYHYEPDRDGGTAISDVLVNDGDFAVKRRRDGSFELRLTAARRLESGIGPSLLLLYLIQLMAFEDWTVEGDLTGLPVSMSNPSVAFEGVVRGLRYRYRDLGYDEALALQVARGWIEQFGRSAEGRAYRGWAERFLSGELGVSFGDDLREHWWRLLPLQKRQSLLELRARREPSLLGSSRALRSLLERLGREIGRIDDLPPGSVRINELDRPGLLALFSESALPELGREGAADAFFERWPYRNFDELAARVPVMRALRSLKSRLDFGRVVTEADEGTLKSLPAPVLGGGTPRAFANAEIFSELCVRAELHGSAVRAFPTFEVYMDSALFDADFGYYVHHVSIGRAGHFETHPESLSPHYGRWLAELAYRAWRELLARGELTALDAFPVIEFGAGNGRLARDFLDAIAESHDAQRKEFAARVEYRIYEASDSLRERQRALLGARARVEVGDARRPLTTLLRDFPDGVRGLVMTNEVPDAFGVHKVALSANGEAACALVVPRVERGALEVLEAGFGERIRAADSALRQSFGIATNPGDYYLDAATYTELMAALARVSPETRRALWFEELYVPIAEVPELAEHFRLNADQYATALAAEDSGVVLYVNVHADRFIRELGEALVSGFAVTIDYGDTTSGLVQGARRGEFPFRVYGDWQEYVPRPNDPYSEPGNQDMTADVNFTALARAGEAAGLAVVHFGPERDVTGRELEGLLDSSLDDVVTADFLGNPVFKLLVQSKTKCRLFEGVLFSPLPLFCREQDVAKARRQRVAAIRRALGG